MDPIVILSLLIGAAILLVVAEAFLPTHGILGGVGVLMLVAAIGVGFTINQWTGATVFAGSAVFAPLLILFTLKMWQTSPIGKRITLHATTRPLEHEQIHIGDLGRTVSELRPMGEAEFGPVTVQVIAHVGTISAGKPIRVVAYRDGVATVERADVTRT